MTKKVLTQDTVRRCQELYLKAQQYQKSGDLNKAKSLYEKALKLIPNQPDVSHYLGLIYMKRGSLEKADKLIQNSIHTPNPIYYSNYGLLLVKKKDELKAIEYYKKGLSLKPDYPEAWFNLALSQSNTGNTDDAIASYQQALKLRPDYFNAIANLSSLYLSVGRETEALALESQLRAADPHDQSTLTTIAAALYQLGGYDNSVLAIQHSHKALSLPPFNIKIAISLASMYVELNKYDKAKEIFKKSLVRQPDHNEAKIKYANLLVSMQEYITAEKLLTNIIPEDNFVEHLYAVKGDLEVVRGNFQMAKKHYQAALKINPEFIPALWGLARSEKVKAKENSLFEDLQKLKERPGRTDTRVLFSLGKLHDDVGNYSEAFINYKEGNDIRNKMVKFNHDEFRYEIDKLIDDEKEYNHDKNHNSIDSKPPIFIVGTPRSGTTLTEQLISGHPDVYGAGELNKINVLKNEVANDTKQYQFAAQRYIDDVMREHDKTYHYFTDKMPHNVFNIGFINRLYKNPKIIHCRRHPVDSCLSMYFQYFNLDQNQTYCLDNLIFWFREYDRIVKFWKGLFKDQITDIFYDVTVDKTELAARYLLGQCDLKWDEKVLEFHKNMRVVSTASQWQVRQPIYKSAKGRWRNYEGHISKLVDGLSDLSDEYNVEMAKFEQLLQEIKL